MRKSTKVILITALVCMIIGIALTVGGAIAASKDGNIKDILGNLNSDYGINISGVSDFDSKTYEEMAVFDASEVKSVNINLSVSAIKIVKSEDENCNLYVEDGKSHLINAQTEDNILNIDDDNGYYGWSFWKRNKGVYAILELPEKVYDDINVYVDFGYIYTENLSADNYNLEVNAGKIQLDSIDASDMYLNCDMGEIKGKSITAGYLQLDCDMGNIDLNQIDSKDTDIDCDMGNINAEFVGAYGDYDITTNNDMGHVSIDKSDSSVSEGSHSRTIDANCDMGNINVTFIKKGDF